MALLRYWAGVRAAAGVAEEPVAAATLAEALDAARAPRDERFARVLSVCSFVVDEQPVGRTPHAQVPSARQAETSEPPAVERRAPVADDNLELPTFLRKHRPPSTRTG